MNLDTQVFKDLNDMHNHFGFHEKVNSLSKTMLKEYLEFRFRFLEEELHEGKKAIEQGNPEEVVDALIDLIVVAVGTLDLYQVDSHRAWTAVHAANMSKEVGVKPGRPNPFGLPDLVKPKGWQPPIHTQTGLIEKALEE